MGATKERPILFSGPMVRALLEGRKTQTRRVVKPQTRGVLTRGVWRPFDPALPEDHEGMITTKANTYGQPGDRLWVRETWRPIGERPLSECEGPEDVQFAADADEASLAVHRWRPSIHMPRWASRLTLEVTEVRVQRLQEISEADARAEGVQEAPFCKAGRPDGMEHVESFELLWQSINGDRPGCSWDENPWVWCVSFRRLA